MCKQTVKQNYFNSRISQFSESAKYVVLSPGETVEFLNHQTAFDYCESLTDHPTRGVYKVIGIDTLGLVNGWGDYQNRRIMESRTGFKFKVI